VVRAAAALAAVNCKARGLEDFGKAEDWHARQVPRWMGQLESYAATPGYDGSAFRVDDIAKWLDTNIVSDRRIGLIHGDFQFPNMMFSLEAPVISGLIDWELSTLGDPLLDFAWTLSSWWDDGDPVGSAPPCTPWDGFMTRGELVSLYGELSGRDMGGMPWFLVLACYKLGIILEGSYVRSKTGAMPIATGEMLHGYALRLLNKARQVMASGTI